MRPHTMSADADVHERGKRDHLCHAQGQRDGAREQPHAGATPRRRPRASRRVSGSAANDMYTEPKERSEATKEAIEAHTSKHTSKRTCKLASEQTHKQTRKQTHKQTHKQPHKQPAHDELARSLAGGVAHCYALARHARRCCATSVDGRALLLRLAGMSVRSFICLFVCLFACFCAVRRVIPGDPRR
jgi:hypothetical protein